MNGRFLIFRPILFFRFQFCLKSRSATGELNPPPNPLENSTSPLLRPGLWGRASGVLSASLLLLAQEDP
eukprot:9471768-Pyramimonas_sp.AAC.2